MSESMPTPGTMGVTISGGVGTLRVYSENATTIELCILDNVDPSQTDLILNLVKGDNHIWQVSHPDLKPGAKYALRADGPDAPRNGCSELRSDA